MNTLKVLKDDFSEWRCEACDEPLVFQAVDLQYLSSQFHVELPCCPKCGFVLIPEDLATGKMLEVERLLEDK